jgi:HEPN domain-containing protein
MRRKKPLNAEARSSYSMALKYLGAANKLYALSLATGKRAQFWPWSSPIHFLYFHTIELALKAYLRSFNLNVKRTHKITNLYRQCRKRGLRIRPDDSTGIANVINLLALAGDGRDFRYYSPMSAGSLPTLQWTRYEANQLMRVVGRRVRRMGFTTKPGPVARLAISFERPEKQ